MMTGQLTLWAVLIAAAIVGAIDSAKHVADIQALHKTMENGFASLGAYNGGVEDTARLAHAVYQIRSASITARQGLERAEPFSDEDAQAIADSFCDFQPQAVSTLKGAKEKMPQFTIPGTTLAAKWVLQHIHDEKKSFVLAMTEKMPGNHSDRVVPLSDEIDHYFEESIRAFDH